MTDKQHAPSTAAVSFTVMAGVLMVVLGAYHAIAGLTALFNDQFLVVGEKWVATFDVTAWGWIHLILGIAVIIAGIALFSGSVLARTVGVGLAGLSALANFLWLPYYPVWAVVMIAFDVFVIWALTAHGRDITRI
jgi:hypothetical protein